MCPPYKMVEEMCLWELNRIISRNPNKSIEWIIENYIKEKIKCEKAFGIQ